jgi:hypothetical protein
VQVGTQQGDSRRWPGHGNASTAPIAGSVAESGWSPAGILCGFPTGELSQHHLVEATNCRLGEGGGGRGPALDHMERLTMPGYAVIATRVTAA